MKILIVSSIGGHLTEVMRLAPLFAAHETVLVLNEPGPVPDFPFARVYRIAHAHRDARVLLNFCEAARILLAERPDVILSCGAGQAVPVALVAKYAAGAKVVFVESAASVEKPSLTGRLMYLFADAFFYQWRGLGGHFRRGELRERGLFMRVFVTVGNALYPFDRMLQMVDDALVGIPDVEGVCQHGPNKVRPRHLTPIVKLPWNEFDAELKRADIVVCQAGVGTLWSTLDAGHRPLVVPRRAPHGEIVNDHQVEIVNELAGRGLIIPIHDAAELHVWFERCQRGEIRRSDALRPAAPPLDGIAKAIGSAHARPSRAGTLAMRALSLLSPSLDQLRIR